MEEYKAAKAAAQADLEAKAGEKLNTTTAEEKDEGKTQTTNEDAQNKPTAEEKDEDEGKDEVPRGWQWWFGDNSTGNFEEAKAEVAAAAAAEGVEETKGAEADAEHIREGQAPMNKNIKEMYYNRDKLRNTIDNTKAAPNLVKEDEVRAAEKAVAKLDDEIDRLKIQGLKKVLNLATKAKETKSRDPEDKKSGSISRRPWGRKADPPARRSLRPTKVGQSSSLEPEKEKEVSTEIVQEIIANNKKFGATTYNKLNEEEKEKFKEELGNLLVRAKRKEWIEANPSSNITELNNLINEDNKVMWINDYLKKAWNEEKNVKIKKKEELENKILEQDEQMSIPDKINMSGLNLQLMELQSDTKGLEKAIEEAKKLKAETKRKGVKAVISTNEYEPMLEELRERDKSPSVRVNAAFQGQKNMYNKKAEAVAEAIKLANEGKKEKKNGNWAKALSKFNESKELLDNVGRLESGKIVQKFIDKVTPDTGTKTESNLGGGGNSQQEIKTHIIYEYLSDDFKHFGIYKALSYLKKQELNKKEDLELKKKIIKKSELYGTLLWMNININNTVINDKYIESMLRKSYFKFYLFYDAIVILFPPHDDNTNVNSLTKLPQENGYAFKVEYIKFANGEIINYRELLLLSKEKLKVKLKDSKIIYFRDSKHYLQDYLSKESILRGGSDSNLSNVLPPASAQYKTFIMIIIKILANLNSKTNNLIKLEELKEQDLGNTKIILDKILNNLKENILDEIKEPKKIDTDKLKTMMPLISFDDKKKKRYICGFEYEGNYYPIQLFLSKMPHIIQELPYSLLTYNITDLKLDDIIKNIYSQFENLGLGNGSMDLLYDEKSNSKIGETLNETNPRYTTFDNYALINKTFDLKELIDLFKTLINNDSVKVYYISDLKKFLIDGGKRDQSNINNELLLSGKNSGLTKSMSRIEVEKAKARARSAAVRSTLSNRAKSISSLLGRTASGIAEETSGKYKYFTGKKRMQEQTAKQAQLAQQGGKGNVIKKKYKKMIKTKKIYKLNKNKTQKYKK